MDTQKMETQKKEIAVVLLNWNGVSLLKKFLPTLIKYSSQGDIFIIDNASTDNSIIFLKKNYPDLNLILNKKNNGYASGYNEALTKINYKYYVLINSDVEVSKNWLSNLVSPLKKDPKASACQPKILDYNKRDLFEYAGASGGFIDFLGYPYCRGRLFNIIEKDSGQYDNISEIFWASGACIAIRSDHFWKVQGFDNDFFAHQEEIDLCWRLKNLGFKILVQPKSVVYHVGGGTLSNESPYKTYLNFRNNLIMLFKNLPLYSLLYLMPLRFLLDGFAAITFLPKKNGFKHFLSIIRAHISFYIHLPSSIKKRRKILQRKNHVGKTNYSLVLKTKIKKVKKFSDLTKI